MLGRYDPAQLVARLDALANELDEQTEDKATEFVDGDMDAKAFLKPFIEARTMYHLRKAKVERFRAGGVSPSVIR